MVDYLEEEEFTEYETNSYMDFEEDEKKYHSCSTLSSNSTNNKEETDALLKSKKAKNASSSDMKNFTSDIINSPSSKENICSFNRKLNKEKNIRKNICFFSVENIFEKNIDWFGIKLNIIYFLLACLYIGVGFLLFMLQFDINARITSKENVEGFISPTIFGLIMVFCGFLTLGTGRYPNKYLISVVLILSLTCTSFCIASLIHLIGEVHANLRRLQNCWFNSVDKSCTCYVKSETHYKPVRFAKVNACSVVKDELKTLVVGVTVLFGIGFVISIVAAITAIILLYRKFKQSSEQRRNAQLRTSVYSQTEESEFNCERFERATPSIAYRENSMQSLNSEEKQSMISDTSSDDFRRQSLSSSGDDLPAYPPPTYQESVGRKILNEEA